MAEQGGTVAVRNGRVMEDLVESMLRRHGYEPIDRNAKRALKRAVGQDG